MPLMPTPPMPMKWMERIFPRNMLPCSLAAARGLGCYSQLASPTVTRRRSAGEGAERHARTSRTRGM